MAKEVELQYLKDLFYDSEDSENERTLNTVGNVPLEWYEDYDHVGYDLEGKKILKPNREDKIDQLLAQEQNPWSIYNEKTGKRETISEADMELIKNLQKGAELERYAPENWYIELNEYTDKVHPAANIPPRKAKFIPSKWEAKKIRRLAYAIQKGWLKLNEAKKEDAPKFYLIWDDNDNKKNPLLTRQIAAPKPRLPGHAESYNPPEEYLLDEDEKKAWDLLDPEDRPFNFIPQKNSSLRTTPGYDKIQRDRFERCIDLYLAVRSKRKQRWADPETLMPKIPKPSDLRPFPSETTIIYLGHEKYVRCIDVDPSGQFLLSCSDDKSVRIWEVATGRELVKYVFGSVVYHVEWNPNGDLFLFAAVTEETLFIYSPDMLANAIQRVNTQQFFTTDPKNDNEKVENLVEWVKPTAEEQAKDMRMKINFKGSAALKFVTWHHKGDYISTVCPQGNTTAVLIHQLSKQQSQNPFSKSKGYIQAVRFHPQKPYFFVVTQRQVRVYNLAQQKLTSKLMSGSRWISSIHVHPGGDNLLIGTYDKRVTWFDLDLGATPYKVLRYHKFAVRSVKYHNKYPLFASSSDDGTVHVFHGQVFNDLFQNPFIVPLKVLHGHEFADDLGVLDIVFHPHQPWLFSAGADATIRLYT
uniref:Ribosome biogenesis protein BOP1 homolog n=1 Tax=Arcella intermedia TaxID=1963864 RepID=A0A6B2KZB0_9EUKA